ncbi:MAG: shikimate kinase [Pseudomonadota bacterium]
MTPSPSQNSPPTAIKSHIDKPIVLIGLMGVGKSTIGRRLANRLDLPFVDSDDEIEAAAGMKVGELFENYGEDYFRDGERRVIARLMDGSIKVIATGGGAFVNTQTRELILKEATAVWLDADIDILAERVSRRDTRPLVRDSDPKIVLSELAAKRNRYYSQAPIHVQSGDGAHEDTVDRILEALAK